MTTYYVDGAVGNDSNAGTSPGSGNAWATIAKAASTVVAGDTAYIKASATYTITSTITLSNTGSQSAGAIRYEGYTTTPGARDGRPTITTSTNSMPMLTPGVNFMGITLVHLNFTTTAATRSTFINTNTYAWSGVSVDCVFNGFTSVYNGQQNCLWFGCEFTGFSLGVLSFAS